MKKIYLAHLYSLGAKNPDGSFNEVLLNDRFEHSNMMAARIMEETGYIVFSPISHSHPIQKYCDPKSWVHRFWHYQDKPYLEWCDEMWIAIDDLDLIDIQNSPEIYDWRRSTGVRWEKYMMYKMRKICQEVYLDDHKNLCLKIL